MLLRQQKAGARCREAVDEEARIEADPAARFAVSLDRLAYAKDNHVLGTDLVRTFVRRNPPATLDGKLKEDAARLRGGIRALTGRDQVLGGRYGELTVAVRDAGGSVLDWVTDSEAREVVLRIGAADKDLARRIAARAVCLSAGRWR
ncbi:hypothetical protein C9424_19865 [Arthrobacter sp. H-02-3]|nr:hypothetical protein C9424_19865 [Arthrobacter sp. H-02-3]